MGASYLPRLDRLELFHQEARSDVRDRAKEQEESSERLGKDRSLPSL